ncbi:Hypothetical predicted protein [Pelobates cultripes]|uniref:Sushi domain-containing protein n=1 Tax=Pelobates cultripes TaxID=61616 RepID=A0AAD1T0Q7_PELCU|nr:Hypothetical predicted protein [Pelobates cultripes]
MNDQDYATTFMALILLTCSVFFTAEGENQGTCKVSSFENRQQLPNKTLFKTGEHLQYQCDEGYVSPHKNIVEETMCLSSGWSTILQCIEITCTVPSTTGVLSKRLIYRNSEVAKFSCDDGLMLNGSEISQCHYYGWDPPLPTCEEIRDRCPPRPRPSNTEEIPSKQHYSNGEEVQIKCLPGFKLHGSESILCINGSWTSLPQCICK